MPIHFPRLAGRPSRAALLAVLVIATAAAAGEVESETDQPAAGGRLAWVSSDDIDLLGDLWAELPVVSFERDSLFLSLDTRTTIRQAQSDLTFEVLHLQYEFDVGWRTRRTKTPLFVFGGQRGRVEVDAAGHRFVRYLGVGAESRSFRAHRDDDACTWSDCAWRERIRWRVAGGPSLDERDVSTSFVLRGEAHLFLARAGWARSSFGFDLELDSLVGSDGFDGDLAAGPRWSLPAAGGRTASLYLHYLYSRNPLGLEEDVWLAGFSYNEGTFEGLPRLRPPDVDGVLAGGGGDGRAAGQFKLRFLSPEFYRRAYVILVVDANVLTGSDTDELYYFYHLGVERPVPARSVAGVYFYHRSNHQLATANPLVTSINVLEAGVETDDWHRPGTRPISHAWGELDARARVGFLLSSSFGENRRWHIRGGVRWTMPLRVGKTEPYLLVEAEAGDIERRSYAAGFAVLGDLDVQIQYLTDDQFFGQDHTALLLGARYGF